MVQGGGAAEVGGYSFEASVFEDSPEMSDYEWSVAVCRVNQSNLQKWMAAHPAPDKISAVTVGKKSNPKKETR